MITIFGAPGAGKTVQGQLLARKYNWEWVSYRDLLLSLHDKDIVFALEHGLFIDDAKATRAIQDALTNLSRATYRFASDQIGYKRQLILDGFPATYQQAKWIIENGEIQNLEGAIVLNVPRGELWRRLVERKRVDDTRAAIERREDLYERNVTGMIKLLEKNGVKVHRVSGENAPEVVLGRIEEVLASWGMIPKKQFVSIASAEPLK